MSFLVTLPDLLGTSAGRPALIGPSMVSSNAAAEPPTTQVAPTAAEWFSALRGAHSASHGLADQTVASLANQIHESFVGAPAAGAADYAITENLDAAVTR
ncbi:PE family protein [Mycobacterium helveticum]|uniref:PE family protein n=1 Tax=Mycobacterium helveticum TaxID=2592811 RepID=UPI00143CD51D|nr:PE family protein [Mycobacterium helveticum]